MEDGQKTYVFLYSLVNFSCKDLSSNKLRYISVKTKNKILILAFLSLFFQGCVQVRRQRIGSDGDRQRVRRVQGILRQRGQGIWIHQNQGEVKKPIDYLIDKYLYIRTNIYTIYKLNNITGIFNSLRYNEYINRQVLINRQPHSSLKYTYICVSPLCNFIPTAICNE